MPLMLSTRTSQRRLTLVDLQVETESDPILNKILFGMKSGKLNKDDPEFKDYKRFLEEFSIVRDIILRGDRILLPPP